MNTAHLEALIARAGLADVVELRERVFATRAIAGPAATGLRLAVIADVAAGLDETARRELGELLHAAVTAADDEQAWRPLCRARRLLERAAIVRRAGR